MQFRIAIIYLKTTFIIIHLHNLNSLSLVSFQTQDVDKEGRGVAPITEFLIILS